MKETIELSYHEAYGKSLHFVKKFPQCLPIELSLQLDGLWVFRMMKINHEQHKEISGLIYEFVLNPDNEE